MKRAIVKIINDAAAHVGVKVISIEQTKKHIKVYVRGSYTAMVTVSLTPHSQHHLVNNIARDMKAVTSQPQRGQ
jgi:hypothetical protein